jgi:hypothetical protein
MHHKGLTLLEVLVIVTVVFILAALLVPSIHPPGGHGRRVSCTHNLRQLYQLGIVYASSHKGNWPEAGENGLWLTLARTEPPLIEPEQMEVLLCPVKGDSEPGECDFRSSRRPYRSLTRDDVLGADKPGNHGDEFGGNVLRADGSVVEVDLADPFWELCGRKLAP